MSGSTHRLFDSSSIFFSCSLIFSATVFFENAGFFAGFFSGFFAGCFFSGFFFGASFFRGSSFFTLTASFFGRGGAAFGGGRGGDARRLLHRDGCGVDEGEGVDLVLDLPAPPQGAVRDRDDEDEAEEMGGDREDEVLDAPGMRGIPAHGAPHLSGFATVAIPIRAIPASVIRSITSITEL